MENRGDAAGKGKAELGERNECGRSDLETCKIRSLRGYFVSGCVCVRDTFIERKNNPNSSEGHKVKVFLLHGFGFVTFYFVCPSRTFYVYADIYVEALSLTHTHTW